MTDLSKMSAVVESVSNGTPHANHHSAQPNGETTAPATANSAQKMRDNKYRHVFATHSQAKTSVLSQDAEATPSFVGFRNLMAIVLCWLSPQFIPERRLT